MVHGLSQRSGNDVGFHCHFRFPSFESGFQYGIPEERDSGGVLPTGGTQPPWMGSEGVGYP